jgi:hypothetical protein
VAGAPLRLYGLLVATKQPIRSAWGRQGRQAWLYRPSHTRSRAPRASLSGLRAAGRLSWGAFSHPAVPGRRLWARPSRGSLAITQPAARRGAAWGRRCRPQDSYRHQPILLEYLAKGR